MRVGVININIPLGTVLTFSISVFNITWDRVVLSPLKVGPEKNDFKPKPTDPFS